MFCVELFFNDVGDFCFELFFCFYDCWGVWFCVEFEFLVLFLGFYDFKFLRVGWRLMFRLFLVLFVLIVVVMCVLSVVM